MATVRKPYYKVRQREDVDWWRGFAARFNGISAMIGRFSPVKAVYSDASTWGFGATCLDDWVVGSFGKDDAGPLASYAGHHHYP